MKPILITLLAVVLVMAAGCAAAAPAAVTDGAGGQITAGEPVAFSEALSGSPAPAESDSPSTTPDKADADAVLPETGTVAASAAATHTAGSQGDDAIRTATIVAAAAVYAEPDSRADVLGELQAGRMVVVTQTDGQWMKILYVGKNHRYGWIQGDVATFDIAASLTKATATATVEVSPTATAVAETPAASENASASTASVGLPAAAQASTTSQRASSGSGLTGRLVFQDVPGGMIYVYDLESQTLRTLTGGFDPALSPDGKTVAFTRQGGEQGLYLIDINDCQNDGCDAGVNERLIYSGSEELRAPDWSPDGQYIVFSRVSGHTYCRQVGPLCVPDRPGLEDFPLITMDKRGLSRVDYDGNNYRDIVALETANAPDWTDAGIVYESKDGIQITADAPEADNSLLLGGWEYRYEDPAWQPGGGRIVFQSKEGSHAEIYAVNADGSGLTPLTRPLNGLADELPQNVSPAWSPDGRSIVFLSNRDENNSAGQWRLWVMDADGGNQRLLDPEVLGQISFRYDNHADQMADWSR
ncbi:MAG: hypothetical protein R2844_16825 [Caldilineales bacterium]